MYCPVWNTGGVSASMDCKPHRPIINASYISSMQYLWQRVKMQVEHCTTRDITCQYWPDPYELYMPQIQQLNEIQPITKSLKQFQLCLTTKNITFVHLHNWQTFDLI